MSDDCIALGPGDEETSGAILDSEIDDLYDIDDEESEEEFEDEVSAEEDE